MQQQGALFASTKQHRRLDAPALRSPARTTGVRVCVCVRARGYQTCRTEEGRQWGACLVCLCLLAVTGRSRAQALAGVDIQDAADKLGARFEDIRKYGLGADALKVSE